MSSDGFGSGTNMDDLQSRNGSLGFARRTIKNLDFIKNSAGQSDVHLVTQVINSLLGLLVFPYEDEENPLSEVLPKAAFTSSQLSDVRDKLVSLLPIPSLKVEMFGRCKDVSDFFRRLRNAIAHKYIVFGSNSRSLPEVVVFLKDRIPGCPYDWEISMTARDLESLSRYIADRIIEKCL